MGVYIDNLYLGRLTPGQTVIAANQCNTGDPCITEWGNHTIKYCTTWVGNKWKDCSSKTAYIDNYTDLVTVP